ncbi:carboxylating nicotinate-nucleotide diphosphorylase [Nitrosomonas oligotropha]|uniref:Probable nicotinate-nucleotide pyrophosphorylase [carboxylating] n=1 Tax=Nitrosomonas oligotropha TaxID=42354 RepID=A0A1H8LBI6_9PROT|nr:carboxylating nicotinate-nucleotide diphosphorylase [Nitrosomonas oligotropha]SDW21332.1 nicotinate-nucleotide pyrophosphorylase [carboxylating] [Nitrosomonas oligotropha]SEO02166.1 nicotinate-nucleotide pyrophosphorylase [carboxylating] [Nitrosomonas oligotropha]
MLDLHDEICANVQRALQEDIGSGDLTASLIPVDKTLQATVISREDAVLCGMQWFEACFVSLAADTEIEWCAKDGDAIHAGQTLCKIKGNARALLTAERSALNFLQLLSAVATQTRRYADAVAGTRTVIVDTRKTLPGLRLAQKYAVTCGGGVNHRIGLYDGILIKENHIIAAGGIQPALSRAREIAPPGVFIQIEVESLQELQEALAAGAHMVLLDNFTLNQLADAVTLARKQAGKAVILEASGNITLDNLRQVAETGVDRISIGGLTKNIQAIDLSMRFAEPE